MTLHSYDIGDTVRFTATFANYLGSPAIPATVVARVRNPSLVVATYYYTAGSIVSLGSGVYTFDYIPTVAGEHFVRIEGLGSNLAAEEFTLDVRRSAF